MSHIVTIQTEVRDATAASAACRRLGLSEPVRGTAELFSGQASGLVVHFRDWRYPLVCDLGSGTLHYDNYEGHWGSKRRLDEFLQAYAVEKAKLEARKQGHTVFEQPLADGSIKVTVHVAGGAA